MKKEVGLWIDHREAVLVILSAAKDEIKHITSNMEKRTRFSNASHAQTPGGHDNSTEDKRDRRFDDHLDKYYDAVIAVLHDTDSILIMGPGEAKGELQKRLAAQHGSKPIAAIETTDKLTDGQIAAAEIGRAHV